MHERNDQTLYRPAHGRAPYGTRHSEIGLDKQFAQLKTSTGPVEVEFDSKRGGQVSIADDDPLFRILEQAWNGHDRAGLNDVHQRFTELAEGPPSGRFDSVQQRRLVHDFLRLAAAALEALSNGQHAEVASLEEHARHLYLNTISKERS